MWHLSNRVVAIVVLMTIVIGRAGLAQKDAPAKVSLTISAPPTVVAGSPLMLEVVLQNTSSKVTTLGYDGWHVAETLFGLQVEDSSGRIVPDQESVRGYTSLVVLDLKPKETMKVSVDLIKHFDLQPGTYSVRAKTTDREFWMAPHPEPNLYAGRMERLYRLQPDIYAAPGKITETPARGETVTPPPPGKKVKSNVITVTVLPD